MAELVFGNVKHPAFLDRPIQKAEGRGQNDLGQRTVKGVSWHRIYGYLWGTDTYFRRADVNALTDYGVGVAAADGADHAGEILKWNDPLGTQSGWASGVFSAAAYGDGLAFANKYGVNAINRDRASIEISGYYDTPLDEQARRAIAEITAYWADQAKIPWDVFPIVPADGFSFVCWHNEFGPENGQKVCPGSVVMNETSALIERVRGTLRAAQVGNAVQPKPPVYTAPVLPEWFEESLTQLHPSDAIVDGARYWAVRRNVEALGNTRRLSAPDLKANESGPKVATREKVYTERQVTNDGRTFWLTNDGHYVLASKFTPDVRLRSR